MKFIYETLFFLISNISSFMFIPIENFLLSII